MERFIVVIGMPSGGTSAVAKAMCALGVNMGRVRRWRTRNRKYANYECRRFFRVMGRIWEPGKDWEEVCRAVHEYIRKRTRWAWRPQGCKFPAFARITQAPEQAWRDLPIRIVNVARPLEEVLASNIAKLGKKAPEVRQQEIHTLWQERERLLDKIPPVHTVEYHKLIENPLEQTRELARALHLEPPGDPETDRRARKILRAVDPSLRTFGR